MKSKIQFLTSAEIKEFEKHPMTNADFRRDHFVLSDKIKAILHKVKGPAKVLFWVRLVYFKTKCKIYQKVSPKDVAFAAKTLGLSDKDLTNYDVTYPTFQAHKELILQHFGFKNFGPSNRKMILDEVRQLLKLQKRPLVLWKCLLSFLIDHKIEIPTYVELEDIIEEAKVGHDCENDAVSKMLSPKQKKILKKILKEKVSEEEKNKPGLIYQISKLKDLNQSQKVKDIKETIEQFRLFKQYYHQFSEIIENYHFSNEGHQRIGIEFIKMDLSKIKRFNAEKQYLHLLCFIRHQYFRLGDHLLDIFLNMTQKYIRTVKAQCNDSIIEETKQRNKNFSDLINIAETETMLLEEIEHIVKTELPSDEKVENVEKVLKRRHRVRNKITNRLQEIKEDHYKEDIRYTSFLEENIDFLKRRVFEFLPLLEFYSYSPIGKSTLDAVQFISVNDDFKIEHAPNKFLSEKEIIQTSYSEHPTKLYQAYLITSLSSRIKSGEVNLKHSYKFRCLDDYLIPKAEWIKDRDQLLKQAGLSQKKNVLKIIDNAAQKLDKAYAITNESINQGLNPHITIETKGKYKYKLRTPGTDYMTENHLLEYFPQNKYISLSEVLAKIHEATGFFDHLFHLKQKYVKDRPNLETFIAGTIGSGCNIGPHKMAKISKHVSYPNLTHSLTWYFTPESVTQANDAIVNYLNALSLPKLLQENMKVLYTSSDGMKWKVDAQGVYSKGSYKYYGQGTGVSFNSSTDERLIALHSKIITSTDREAASVLDLLIHNEEIKSDVHSTDTHGYTEALFGTMNLLGYKFAPRIKAVKKQQIYSFLGKKNAYRKKGYQILPDGNINTSLIIENWDDVLRLMVTIKLKRCTAYQIFKRLNSYSTEQDLYLALKEFGKIEKSSFILEYINDLEFRQRIERILNKIEESNRLSRAICFGNSQELLGGDIESLETGDACRRLIKNAIICWNYLFLSQKIMKEKRRFQRARILWAVRNSSILHWQHINFHGEYDFSKNSISDSQGIQHWRIPDYNLVKMWEKDHVLLEEHQDRGVIPIEDPEHEV
jgi:TnpA family transposase